MLLVLLPKCWDNRLRLSWPTHLKLSQVLLDLELSTPHMCLPSFLLKLRPQHERAPEIGPDLECPPLWMWIDSPNKLSSLSFFFFFFVWKELCFGNNFCALLSCCRQVFLHSLVVYHDSLASHSPRCKTIVSCVCIARSCPLAICPVPLSRNLCCLWSLQLHHSLWAHDILFRTWLWGKIRQTSGVYTFSTTKTPEMEDISGPYDNIKTRKMEKIVEKTSRNTSVS